MFYSKSELSLSLVVPGQLDGFQLITPKEILSFLSLSTHSRHTMHSFYLINGARRILQFFGYPFHILATNWYVSCDYKHFVLCPSITAPFFLLRFSSTSITTSFSSFRFTARQRLALLDGLPDDIR